MSSEKYLHRVVSTLFASSISEKHKELKIELNKCPPSDFSCRSFDQDAAGSKNLIWVQVKNQRLIK